MIPNNHSIFINKLHWIYFIQLIWWCADQREDCRRKTNPCFFSIHRKVFRDEGKRLSLKLHSEKLSCFNSCGASDVRLSQAHVIYSQRKIWNHGCLKFQVIFVSCSQRDPTVVWYSPSEEAVAIQLCTLCWLWTLSHWPWCQWVGCCGHT